MFFRRFASSILLSLLIITTTGGAYAAGEDISVSARLEKSTVRMGETVNFLVTAQWSRDEGLNIQISSPPQTSGFKITGTAIAARTSRDKGSTVYRKVFSYTLRPVTTGNARIGAVTLEYGAGDQKGNISTKGINIKILPEPKSHAPLIKKILLGALALVVLVVGGRMGIASIRKKKAAALALVAVEKTIEEIALDKIKEGEGLDDSRKYFTLISSALREYLQGKFDLNTKASSQIPAALKGHGATPDYVDRVEHILIACDAVKFAGHLPDKEKVRQVQDDFITLIKMTP